MSELQQRYDPKPAKPEDQPKQVYAIATEVKEVLTTRRDGEAPTLARLLSDVEAGQQAAGEAVQDFLDARKANLKQPGPTQRVELDAQPIWDLLLLVEVLVGRAKWGG
ncbi:MAG: hypothetical protein U9R79_02735 [Armatimonadota bacterium]|nr:hypothetical protein [Armatimonadota bacterium]